LDGALNRDGGRMRFVYGGDGELQVERRADPDDPTRFVGLDLEPMQFAILERVP
jgi:alpha-amylase